MLTTRGIATVISHAPRRAEVHPAAVVSGTEWPGIDSASAAGLAPSRPPARRPKARPRPCVTWPPTATTASLATSIFWPGRQAGVPLTVAEVRDSCRSGSSAAAEASTQLCPSSIALALSSTRPQAPVLERWRLWRAPPAPATQASYLAAGPVSGPGAVNVTSISSSGRRLLQICVAATAHSPS